jgi:hypothetical protein
MSETPIGSTATGNSCNRLWTSGGNSLLEELRAEYQGPSHEERQQIKSVMLTLSTCNSDLLRRKESTHRRDAYGTTSVGAVRHALMRWAGLRHQLQVERPHSARGVG